MGPISNWDLQETDPKSVINKIYRRFHKNFKNSYLKLISNDDQNKQVGNKISRDTLYPLQPSTHSTSGSTLTLNSKVPECQKKTKRERKREPSPSTSHQ